MKNKELFPFAEGENYWTIEEGDTFQTIMSCWDDQSEELHTLGMNDGVYYSTLEDVIAIAIKHGYEEIIVHDYRISPYTLTVGRPNKYKRVFQISFDIAETDVETEQDRNDLCYSIENFINDFVDVRGKKLNFHCVNGVFPIEDMSDSYGENELKQLND